MSITLGLVYFKPPSNLQDSFMPYLEENLHFFLNNQLMYTYFYYTSAILALTFML